MIGRAAQRHSCDKQSVSSYGAGSTMEPGAGERSHLSKKPRAELRMQAEVPISRHTVPNRARAETEAVTVTRGAARPPFAARCRHQATHDLQ